jgi:lipopolysaccharide cholinephosphotransferase
MKKLTLPELKANLLEILLFFDDFCRKNDIRYSLAGGTLLGAVRHKGFIPWDDDIDVMMPRPDYNKFISCFGNRSYNYKIQCYEKDRNTFFAFAKVFDVRTKLFEHNKNTGLGINVDIFPIDGFDFHQKIYTYKLGLRILKICMLIKKYGFHLERKHPVYSIINVFLKPIPMRLLGFMCLRLMTKYNFNASRYVCVFSGYNIEKGVYPQSIFRHYIDIEFEGHLFKSIRDFDIYLSNLYDDYMTLPPLEKQIQKHHSVGYSIPN